MADSEPDGLTKRDLLLTAGGLPILNLVAQAAQAAMPAQAATDQSGTKFALVDCGSHFNSSPELSSIRTPGAQRAAVRVPTGEQNLRGIPFRLGQGGAGAKSWIELSTSESPAFARRVEIPIGREASHVCFAQFCDWDENELSPSGIDAIEKVGQQLATFTFVYENGSEHGHVIRRRFEVASPSVKWGQLCFVAQPHRQHVPSKLTDPLDNAQQWGDLQAGVWERSFGGGTLWISALPNPSPRLRVAKLRLESSSANSLAVCGITLFNGTENPLRCEALACYRITLPGSTQGEEKDRWQVEVDLGVVARVYKVSDFEPDGWLASPAIALGEPRKLERNSRYLYVEVTASSEATLTLHDRVNGTKYALELARVPAGEAVPMRSREARIEILETRKVWVRGAITDASTNQPTPVRLALRAASGRYLPPYGHRAEINSAWFQDYGADLKLMDSSFAYVDGSFLAELPVGDVYVEMSKGFEYQPIRQKITITPGQRELKFEIRRFANLRSERWASADTHVHFLSPSTALLEAQAEDLNLVNLLAAQWGDLFTNVGDFPHGALTTRDGEFMVRVSTENRQHVLGHLALLGSNTKPVYPMSSAGPGESYLGDPLTTSLSEWADQCRERDGLVVAAHFPYPTGELASAIVANKIDAVELWPINMDEHFNNLRFLDWYRYLNCGYRLTAVSGTDKMGAWIAAGAHRVYANLGDEEFTFDNWKRAVRRGNTFMTSGPLLSFAADNHPPGGEIRLRSGGGNIEVVASVQSAVPVHRLDIILNGKRVASQEAPNGANRMELREKITVPGPGWLAARCASRFLSSGRGIAAHTSPVYVVIPGEDLFSAPAASYMLTLIDGASAWAKTLATRSNGESLNRILKTFTESREKLRRRMSEHGAL